MFWKSFLVYDVVWPYLAAVQIRVIKKEAFPSSSSSTKPCHAAALLHHPARVNTLRLSAYHWSPKACCTPIQQKASIKWKPCKLVFIWLLLHLINMFSLLSLSLSPESAVGFFLFSVDFFLFFFYTPASNGFVTLASFFISTNANLVCFRHYTLYISELTGQGLIYQCDISNM